jgi:endonuclease/exonuclease/phosphatase family metal-dependent hydrolase
MIRIATYNVHKCRGMDRRVSVARVAAVIAALDADVVCVQEAVRAGASRRAVVDQVAFLADSLGYHFAFGETRTHRGAAYGNATLSRFPISFHENYDITRHRFERRGCLRTDVRTPEGTFHVFNVHLGTGFFERPHQARHLLSDRVLNSSRLRGPRVVLGDFNEWTRGVATRLMGTNFESADRRLLGRRRSYPGLFPVLHLDHLYYDKVLALSAVGLHRSSLALIASDHLPLVADFEITPHKAT